MTVLTDCALKVGGDNRYPPFEFLNDDGTFKGYNLDILAAIGEELGITISFQAMSWAEAIQAVVAGKIDAIQGMVLSSKREDLFAFSDEYLVVSHSLFVLRNRYDILTLQDTGGLKVAIQKEDISYELIGNQIGAANQQPSFIFTENQEEAFSKLIAGEVDAYVGNRLTGTYIAQKLGKIDMIRLAGQPISPLAYGIAVSRERRELIDLFNRGLRAIKASRQYDAICEKWFGQVVGNLDSHIIESVDVGVIGCERLGTIVSVNSYARSLLNLKTELCLNKYCLETPLVQYFDFGLLHETLGTGKAFFEREIVVNHGERQLFLSYNICPLFGAKGQIIGAVISFRDITEEKVLRERLARKDKMESLGMLLANIAHEIRNPLMSIKTFIATLPRQYDNPRFRAELLKHVPQEIDRLSRIIEEVLVHARPRVPLRQPCNLRLIFNSLLVLLQGHQGKEIKYRIKIPEELAVCADESQLKQILNNILLNAIESIPANGVINVIASKNANRMLIEIRDNGCGITEKDMPYIFDPFFTTKSSGSGLGLFIVYQLVKDNRGDISVTSHPGQGATFRLEFPQEG